MIFSRLSNFETDLNSWETPQAVLNFLLKSEEKVKSLRKTVVEKTEKLEYTTKTESVFNFI